MDPTESQMPMGQQALPALDASQILAGMPTKATAQTAPPPASAGMMQAPSGAPAGMPPQGSPSEPPYDVQLQPDGSSIYITKTQPPVVIGVNRPPKVPPALQQ